ncbi:uncharacterized protein MYCGRDRAFT_51617 [Zymoseptoria tritici IPO323]|uniref:BZIP domain-containing protein n=1 Tax=Zymoseptoria tritici (strain CBS 115943 / IPO323) TaxID=336722 RepID=F9XQQ3_ZYMTI|nr:uncharacterized protein MYCGRDRAFT_51617 [Zymoseptoria tritici IPO323]EGP82396.1 hypothetical protein MYCGRDRAFT_51617 [Zymoseptoria tritici IPO323]
MPNGNQRHIRPSPAPIDKVSERIRNRENQRRLRERRREYTQDLEERLQQFEKKGIEATILVQRAARTVARENRLLRELLHSKGISEAEINQHVNYMIRPAAMKEEHVSTLCLASLEHIKVDAQDQSYYPSRNTSPIASPFPTSGRSNNDEMDCEEAARVITSLRGKVDPEALWPQLGCSTARRTRVKNSVLMTLAL